jgi:hypothetical protein
MTQWERMEEFLYAAELSGMKTFTNHDVAKILGIRPKEASYLIDAYQEAMAKPNCNTLFAVHRTGRTTAAVWHIGHSTKDLRRLTGQFADDVENRLVSLITPMMDHITKLNPKAQPQATKLTLRMGRLIQSLADLVK